MAFQMTPTKDIIISHHLFREIIYGECILKTKLDNQLFVNYVDKYLNTFTKYFLEMIIEFIIESKFYDFVCCDKLHSQSKIKNCSSKLIGDFDVYIFRSSFVQLKLKVQDKISLSQKIILFDKQNINQHNHMIHMINIIS